MIKFYKIKIYLNMQELYLFQEIVIKMIIIIFNKLLLYKYNKEINKMIK